MANRFVESRPISRVAGITSKIIMDMPKNSFLNSYPELKVTMLPDRDVLTFTTTNLHQKLEVYYLRKLRFSIVRNLFSESSSYDMILKWFAWAFWPIIMLLIGAFHKTLSEYIINFLSKPFKRKRPPVGFRP